jgi:hypothetical protein
VVTPTERGGSEVTDLEELLRVMQDGFAELRDRLDGIDQRLRLIETQTREVDQGHHGLGAGGVSPELVERSEGVT